MKFLFVVAFAMLGVAATAAETSVTMVLVDAKGTGAPIGSVRIVETAYGVAFYPNLTGLPPGLHGFHVHESPSCAPAERDGAPVAAMAAGGHLDPAATKHHGEPWGDGHLGDLPPLVVAADGKATAPVLAPRLKLADVTQRSLMVHAGGDNYADQPAPLGGGGGRMACGVIGG
jgi:superoxide dismutase, Cu-Zn family